MEPIDVAELAGAVGGTVLGGLTSRRVCRVCTDSREVREGDLFVALRGSRVDGHQFIPDAVGRGAVAVLARREAVQEPLPAAVRPAPAGPPPFSLIVVDDTLAALQRLAGWYRDRLSACVLAVTGSVGKTTTKDMTAAILERSRPVVRAPASYNNELGLPLAVLSAGADTRALVLEMGMRGPGHIAALAALARPHVGIITNVGEAHIGLLGSLEAIARAKGELLDHLEPGGLAVLNGDDPLVMGQAHRVPEGGRVLTFGFSPGVDVRIESLTGGGLSGTAFRLTSPWGTLECSLPVPGRHLAANAAAAAAAAMSVGASPEDVTRALAHFRSTAMRMQAVEAGGVLVLNDAYNASPASMEAALRTLAAIRAERGGRACAVLGDMLELGPFAPQAHRRLGQQAAREGVDLLVTVGEMAEQVAAGALEGGLDPARIVKASDVGDAEAHLRGWAVPGDVVLVKASRAVGLERLVAALCRRGDGG